MSVSVDTIYQRVLTLANKEQRGYITPQEFNLLANHAQIDILEQYFYDLNRFEQLPQSKNTPEISDLVENISEKLASLITTATVVGGTKIPLGIYRLIKIFVGVYTATQHTEMEVQNIIQSPLHSYGLEKNPIWHWDSIAAPSVILPLSQTQLDIKVYGGPSQALSGITCKVISKPRDVNWGYTVINEQALYNATRSQDFALHASEETNLVIKILELAGITIKKTDIYQMASAEEAQKNKQENK